MVRGEELEQPVGLCVTDMARSNWVKSQDSGLKDLFASKPSVMLQIMDVGWRLRRIGEWAI